MKQQVVLVEMASYPSDTAVDGSQNHVDLLLAKEHLIGCSLVAIITGGSRCLQKGKFQVNEHQ